MYLRLLYPLPPTPIPAMFSLSLGGLCPRPAITFDGKSVIPARVAEDVPIKFLRDILFINIFVPIEFEK
jgi:hypothetical protein